MKKSDYLKIAKNAGEKTASELADEIGYSVPYIHQITKKLRENGINVEFKGRVDEFDDALSELKKR